MSFGVWYWVLGGTGGVGGSADCLVGCAGSFKGSGFRIRVVVVVVVVSA